MAQKRRSMTDSAHCADGAYYARCSSVIQTRRPGRFCTTRHLTRKSSYTPPRKLNTASNKAIKISVIPASRSPIS
jgi:hypothetical protein